MAYLREEGITLGNKVIAWGDITEFRPIYVRGKLDHIDYRAGKNSGRIYLSDVKADLDTVLARIDARKVKRVDISSKTIAGALAFTGLVALTFTLGENRWIVAPMIVLTYHFAVPAGAINDKALRVLMIVFAGATVVWGLGRYLLRVPPG